MNVITLSEYVPVKMPAVLKAARRWGECHVIQGKPDTPRILTHPTWWRDKAAELNRCDRCGGKGWVYTPDDDDIDAMPCPKCGHRHEPAVTSTDEVPF